MGYREDELKLAALKKQLAALQNDLNPKIYADAAEQARFEGIRERAAHVFLLNCKHLPEPGAHDDELSYRKRLADVLKVNSALSRRDLSREPADEFAKSEQQIYADAQRDYLKPKDLKPGEIREVKYRDQSNRTVTEFACGRGRSVFKEVYGDCIGPGLKLDTFVVNGKPEPVPFFPVSQVWE
jgi:hypothetical protein